MKQHFVMSLSPTLKAALPGGGAALAFVLLLLINSLT